MSDEANSKLTLTNLPAGTVTFLFTDIEGSTKLLKQLGANRYGKVLTDQRHILRRAFKQFNGTEIDTQGDSFFVSFPRATQAVAAVVEIQRALAAHDWPEGVEVRLRMGLHTGEPLVANEGYVGMDVHRAARIAHAGHGWQVLLSETTAALVLDELPEGVGLLDLGHHMLKDMRRPEHIRQLVIEGFPAEFPPLNSLEAELITPQHNLPASVSSFVGRQEELTAITNRLENSDTRLLTLIGPPGIGKTRLSIESARVTIPYFQDGVFYVALAPVDDPSLIVTTIIQALGYIETDHNPAMQQLMNGIGDKQMLIVLDNCEHLIEDIALFVSDLLSNCSRLKILATSRESLRIPGEWLYSVPRLKVPNESSSLDLEIVSEFHGLTLFVERARAVHPDFVLTAENIDAIVKICAKLDGLPLAIELIAARIRLMSPEILLERLNAQFILSADGMRAISARQKTLNQAIGWSYDLLPAEDQKLFVYLSVFSGGFTLEMAEAIFSQAISDKSIIALVTSLLDKSLLQRTYDPDTKDESRFNMLETLRHYALERLRGADLEAEARNWHLDYFIDLAEEANKEIHGPGQVDWLERLEIEHGNLRAALGWCLSKKDTESALRLLTALGWAWNMQNYYSEMISWFNRIRALPNTTAYPAFYAVLLNQIGSLFVFTDIHYARSILEESREIWLKLGSAGEQGLAHALQILGQIALLNKDIGTAQSLFESSFELYQKYGDELGMAWLTHQFGFLAYVQEHYKEAEEQYMRSLATFQAYGDKFRVALVLSSLGELMRIQGDYERADKFWTQNLEGFQELRTRLALAYPLHALASVSLRKGEYVKAKNLFGESLRIFNEFGGKNGVALCIAGLAGILGMTENLKRAAQLFGAAETLFENTSPLEPADQKDFDYYVDVVHAQLEESIFEKAWAEGRSMTMERAIKFALEEI
jgi:predicted ATPase/class 3 adenylate cyclase